MTRSSLRFFLSLSHLALLNILHEIDGSLAMSVLCAMDVGRYIVDSKKPMIVKHVYLWPMLVHLVIQFTLKWEVKWPFVPRHLSVSECTKV
jgi:hypothetical protein